MIIDKNQNREIYLGNGTITMGIGSIDGRSVAYHFYESQYHPVGESNKENIGKRIEDLPVKSVALRFTGKDALKSIDMIIEDLQIIKQNITKELPDGLLQGHP